MGLLLGFLGNGLAIAGFAVRVFFLIFGDLFALFIINIATQFEVQAVLRDGSRRCCALGSWESLTGRNAVVGAWLERLQAAWGIGNNSEMASEWWTDVGGPRLRVNLQKGCWLVCPRRQKI